MKNIVDFTEEVYRCMRCGACTAVCPVFAVIQREPAVARGRLRLIREYLDGNQELTPKMRGYLDLCLGCRACAESCPPGVNTDRVIRAARAKFALDRGQPLVRQVLLRSVMNRPERFDRALGSLKLARSTGFSKLLPKTVGLRVNMLPPLPGQTFRERLAGLDLKPGKKKVGFFPGCLDNSVFPQVALASVRVLEKHGFGVIIPGDTVCCGVAHRNYGDLEGARQLAGQNIRAFAGAEVDVILTGCASCGSTLQEYGDLFAGEPGEEAAANFSRKVTDISRFLEGLLEPGTSPVDAVVTYHDPCHMSRYQKIKEAPRKILSATPGVNLVEMAEADRCCGGGGTFNIFHYQLSMEILRRKIENAGRTGASILATSCPSCRIQIMHGIKRHGLAMEVLHPVEILARSYGWVFAL